MLPVGAGKLYNGYCVFLAVYIVVVHCMHHTVQSTVGTVVANLFVSPPYSLGGSSRTPMDPLCFSSFCCTPWSWSATGDSLPPSLPLPPFLPPSPSPACPSCSLPPFLPQQFPHQCVLHQCQRGCLLGSSALFHGLLCPDNTHSTGAVGASCPPWTGCECSCGLLIIAPWSHGSGMHMSCDHDFMLHVHVLCIYLYIYTHTHARTYTHTHTHTHTHIHTHTHTHSVCGLHLHLALVLPTWCSTRWSRLACSGATSSIPL